MEGTTCNSLPIASNNGSCIVGDITSSKLNSSSTGNQDIDNMKQKLPNGVDFIKPNYGRKTRKAKTSNRYDKYLKNVPENMEVINVVDDVDDNTNETAETPKSPIRKSLKQPKRFANKRKGSSSMYHGVYFDKATGRWLAYIRDKGKKFHIHRYNSEEDAARAYDAVVRLKKLDKPLNFEHEDIEYDEEVHCPKKRKKMDFPLKKLGSSMITMKRKPGPANKACPWCAQTDCLHCHCSGYDHEKGQMCVLDRYVYGNRLVCNSCMKSKAKHKKAQKLAGRREYERNQYENNQRNFVDVRGNNSNNTTIPVIEASYLLQAFQKQLMSYMPPNLSRQSSGRGVWGSWMSKMSQPTSNTNAAGNTAATMGTRTYGTLQNGLSYSPRPFYTGAPQYSQHNQSVGHNNLGTINYANITPLPHNTNQLQMNKYCNEYNIQNVKMVNCNTSITSTSGLSRTVSPPRGFSSLASDVHPTPMTPPTTTMSPTTNILKWGAENKKNDVHPTPMTPPTTAMSPTRLNPNLSADLGADTKKNDVHPTPMTPPTTTMSPTKNISNSKWGDYSNRNDNTIDKKGGSTCKTSTTHPTEAKETEKNEETEEIEKIQVILNNLV